MVDIKIVVCIKQVIDPEAKLTLDPKSDLLNEKCVDHVVNPADVLAVEEALRIKAKAGGNSKVTVVTMGQPQAKKSLIECLAMGADQAIHLWDETFEGSDNYVTAIILARAIGLIGYDLIFCGRQASDDNCQQVPAAIAQFLGLPLVSAVVNLDVRLQEKKAIAYRCLERGDREIVECSLPAVFSVDRGINCPRYPKLRSRLLSAKSEIPVWNCRDIGLVPTDVGQSGSLVAARGIAYPRPRTKKVSTPDPNLPPHERLKLLMQGGAVKEKSNLLEGSPEEVASRVTQFLIDEKIVSSSTKKHD